MELPGLASTICAERILEGNARAARHGRRTSPRASPSMTHVRRETWHVAEIERAMGICARASVQSEWSANCSCSATHFGNVFVGIQPAFGYEGDPMRLLFEKGFSPTHAFSAFYRWLREDFAAHAVLHFGTHGALEFMPGKQSGLSAECWPDRLIGDLPSLYLYAANNPSEGTIAKRRAAATLISYLTPAIAHAGLYRGLVDLKASIDRWRGLAPDAPVSERQTLAVIVQAQAAAVDLAASEPAWRLDQAEGMIAAIGAKILEVEYALIPHGMHIVGTPPTASERVDLLVSMADVGQATGAAAGADAGFTRTEIEAVVAGRRPEEIAADQGRLPALQTLAATNRLLAEDHEIPAILAALDGRFVRPAPAGDLIRTPAILPTGRNLHGFDPFRIPSAFALKDGAEQAARLIARHVADGHAFPESVALILWGTDNLKSEGGPIAQVLALMGAKPRFDSYGRICGAELVSLDEMTRPRVDVVITLSGIFRDLLPLQTQMLAEASFLAATADEPVDRNFVRKHALRAQAALGCDIETAAFRVFSNADGAYGANVNHLIENGKWGEEDELAETYSRRKCFAHDRSGRPSNQSALLGRLLSDVDLAYQNLESVELGVTSLDQYVDTLGGIGRATQRAKGGVAVPVYIGDQTRNTGTVRTLDEQIALETRSRILNPKWYEGLLAHGHEGVRQIEHHVTNVVGWSATTGKVAPWIYDRIAETFVLDPEMRARLSALNPTAAAKLAGRLIEASERNYWKPDDAVLSALREAGDDLEDRLEGVSVDVAA